MNSVRESSVEIWGDSIPGRYKGPKMRASLACLRNRRVSINGGGWWRKDLEMRLERLRRGEGRRERLSTLIVMKPMHSYWAYILGPHWSLMQRWTKPSGTAVWPLPSSNTRRSKKDQCPSTPAVVAWAFIVGVNRKRAHQIKVISARALGGIWIIRPSP